MFYLIGIGLNPLHLTLEAKEAIGKCEKVFFESYTSQYSEGNIGELENFAGKKFIELDRKGVEEGSGSILQEANSKDIALLVFGNPLNATTHIQLLLDARKLGVKTAVIAGLSIFDFLGKTGLDSYRFGRVCSIVFPGESYAPESFYDIIEKNKAAGLHTLCLLDIDAETGSLMKVGEALSILEKIEKKKGRSMLQEAVLVGMYGIGSGNEKTKAGTLNKLLRSSYAAFPQSLVVAGELNDKEKEGLRELADWDG